MKKILYILLLAIVFFAVFPVTVIASGSYETAIQNTASNNSIYLPSDLDVRGLRDEVEKLRNENYQTAIKRADDAGARADRLLNGLVGIATIFGIGLAGFTFFVGGDIWRMRRTMRQAVSEVQKITKSTKDERDKLIKQVAEVVKTRKELSSLYVSAKDEKVVQQKQIEEKTMAFEKALSDAYGTISNIGALGTSANFISTASGVAGSVVPTVPLRSGSTIDPMNVGTLESVTRCKHCGRVKESGLGVLSLSDYLLGDPNYVCETCRALGLS